MKKFTAALIILFIFTDLNVDVIFSQQLKKIEITSFKSAPFSPNLDKSSYIPNLSSCLDLPYKLYIQNKDYKQYVHQVQLRLIDDRVVVTVLPLHGQTIDVIDRAALAQFGAQIQARAKHSLCLELI